MDGEKINKLLRDFKDINIAEVLFIITMALLLTKAVDILFPWLAERLTGRLRLYILPTASVLRLVILFLAVATILPMIINFNLQNSLAIIGAAGLALGFAVKDYASSIVGGIVAMFERPFRAGDWVQIEGAYGEVQSVKLRAFRMVTPDDTVVTVPNIKLWQTNIFNSNDGRRGPHVRHRFFPGAAARCHPRPANALRRSPDQSVPEPGAPNRGGSG